MKRALPIILVFLVLSSPLTQAADSWSFGLGMHKGVWLHTQTATSHWTLSDGNGYLLTLTQQAGKDLQSPVFYLRNTISWNDALIDGIARYSLNRNSAALSGLYLGFGPRVTKDWGSFYLNLGSVLASGTFNAKVEQAPGEPAEGLPSEGESVAISFLGLTPAMEGGLDFKIGKFGINLAYSLIGQKKISTYHYNFQGETIDLVQVDGNLAPVTCGGSFLTWSIVYQF